MSCYKRRCAAPFLWILVTILIIGLVIDTDPTFALPKKPARVIQKSPKVTTTTATLRWKKAARAKGYRIYVYSKSAKKYKRAKTIKSKKVTAWTFKGLKPNTTYRYKVCAFRYYTQYYNTKKKEWVTKKPPAKHFKGKTRKIKHFGKCSKVKTVRTKKAVVPTTTKPTTTVPPTTVPPEPTTAAPTDPTKPASPDELTVPAVKVSSTRYLRVDVSWKNVPVATSYSIREYDASGNLVSKELVPAGTVRYSFYNRPAKAQYSYRVGANMRTASGVLHSGFSSPITVTVSTATAKLGQAVYDERYKTKGGKPGDQLQRAGVRPGEVSSVGKWKYSAKSGAWNHWEYVIRFKSRSKALKAAAAMEAGCKNSCIGYDQQPDNGRGELYDLAKSAGWDLSRIKKNCETSCSGMVGASVNCAGVFPQFNKKGDFHISPYDTTTRNFVKPLMLTGAFKVYRASENATGAGDYIKPNSKVNKTIVTTQIYLERGDILVSPGHHTAMVL